jgi:16S rRNA (uracil1498-N3)-methyltransferase
VPTPRLGHDARVPEGRSSHPRSGSRSARPPAFFLAPEATPEAPRLAEEDERHALRVLRLAPGAQLVGLDGRGVRFPLRVRARTERGLELEAAGDATREPEPGEAGAPLPWIELAVAWPRKNRVEDMLDRLVQLGAAAIRPLEAEHRGPEEVPSEAPPRHLRIAREACKQSQRAWLPELLSATTPLALAAERRGAALAWLDPDAGLSLDAWLRSLAPAPLGVGTRARPITLAIGPEGGWSTAERAAFEEHGANATWLGPNVLRVETAAEAAMAIAAVLHGRAATPQR